MIDRMKKVYSTINIESLLKKIEIDFSKPDDLESWLPIEFFEDKDLDIYNPHEWLNKAADSEGNVLYIPGIGLHRDQHGIGKWSRVLVNSYDPKSDKFGGIWEENSEQFWLSKIYLLFDAENPYLFCKKVALAHSEREKAESIIRYNFYIDKMVIETLADILDEQKIRLRRGIESIPFYKTEQKQIEDILKELNYNFLRTTNKIIFDKFYYSESQRSLLINNLKLPNHIINNPDIRGKQTRYYGLESVPSYNYIESFKNFNFKTLLCRKEIIDCLQKIKEECNKIRETFSIFFFDIKKPLRLQEFKTLQKSSYNSTGKKLEVDWIKTIKDTLEKSLNGVGKGSFNLKVASKEIYEYLKLKKYMTVVKLVMQDTLNILVTKSMTRYVEFFESFIPEDVIIEDVNKVEDIFPAPQKEIEDDKLNTTNDLIKESDNIHSKTSSMSTGINDDDEYILETGTKWPLFQINITKKEDKRIEYTTKSEELINEILKIMDEGLERMQQIPQVEPLLLPNLIKKAEKQKIPLKTIVRPKAGKPLPTTHEQIKNGFELNDEALWIWDLYDRLKDSLRKACRPLNTYLETFKKYNNDLLLDPNEYMRKIKEDKSDFWNYQQIRKDIIVNKKRELKILEEIPKLIHVSIFQINCKEFRSDLAAKFAKISDLEIEYLKEKVAELMKEILNRYQLIKKEIQREINTIADLVAVQNYIETLEVEIQMLREKTREVDEIFSILEEFNVVVDTIQFDFRIQLIGAPTDIENTKRYTNIILEKKKEILYIEQIENQQKLLEGIQSLSSNVKDFDQFKTENKSNEAISLAMNVHDKLTDYIMKAQMYNERESLFGKPKTDYSVLYDLKQQFDPYYWLWTSISSWKTHTKSWYEDSFNKLKGEEVETVVGDLGKDLRNAIFKFKERHADLQILELAQKYKNEVDKFRPKADLAIAITKKGMKDRHWNEILDKTKIYFNTKDSFTFKNVIDAGMLNYLDICSEIGDKAYREYQIENEINEIDKKWREIYFITVPHKTKVPSITNWNDINKELDQDIMQVQQLDISPYKGPFTESISVWLKDLIVISNVLEEWNKCQKSWIYLQPVFDSSDIAKDIPHEHKKFMMTDRMWRDLMFGLEKPPLLAVKSHCSREGLLEKLREANMNLENVEKGLNHYMEKKRSIFPRFFFISNHQFLEILSQTKDLKRVNDNVKKIFEPVENIEMKDDKYIVKIKSRLGEVLNLIQDVQVISKNVECWMLDLEDIIFKTVRWYLDKAIKDYMVKSRKEWVKHHPGQILMCGNQIAWTREVESTIGENTLSDYIAKYDQRIFDLVTLVREKQSKTMSINLSNLLTLDIHNKNVMLDLKKNNITSINAFEWIMQLRYYWEERFDHLTNKSEMNCVVKSVQTNFPYGYEYMGDAEILVITPLTDKCYLTLMGALRLNLGGAPAGPAGTGKTETTKDLARSVAKLCIVYNCSNDTDYIIIGKFFKGLAWCGAWICFDEFNRINIEVLSVIAQQLTILFQAKDKGNNILLNFEGSEIKILPSFCVFITMNPGYAGRTELPDNLKALFRSIAMMVPDYRLIAEINLYSSGYIQAYDLATKVVSTMKLSSEQLSTQGHYDFGMRAVKSVLNAARRLKRSEVDTNEDQLLLRALEDVNVPKFVKEDLPLFSNIIKDLFPKTQRPKIDYSYLIEKINIACHNNNLIATDAFISKIIQLYDTLQVRHGLMLVGPAGGGKTANYTILKQALSMINDCKQYFKTENFVINPKSISCEDIYSRQNPDTGEWSLGVLPIILNECKADTSSETKYWIIFDGPVDAMWIENMNSVLDDSKKLCLASSDIILLNEMITIMFEVEDLLVASPATVSRCGMVFMEPSALGLNPLVQSWTKKISDIFNGYDTRIPSILMDLFNRYLEDAVNFVRKRLKEPCPSVDNNLASSVMRVIETFFEKFTAPEAKYKKYNDEMKIIENNIEGIFYYSFVWSMGVTTNEEGRKRFNEYFLKKVNENCIDPKFAFPQDGNVYDYMFDPEKEQWVNWLNVINPIDIPVSSTYIDIIVPTPDSIRYSYLIKQLSKNMKHVITTGPTGTGKTTNIMEILSKSLGEKYIGILINFSAQTTSNQTQIALEEKMQKIGRNKLGPKGNKLGAVFIDDLNMPVRQESGAQPPIELLRQWLDHRGWYDLRNMSFINCENIVIMGAMGIPGGGRNPLSQRFQRHFNLVTYNELEDNSINIIFNTIVKYFLSKFPDEIKNRIQNVVSSTLNLYKEIKSHMLPTPAKMHYIFNLRDMSKVLQGVCSLSIKSSKHEIDIVKLWFHEMTRVFGDRLISTDDKDWLRNKIEKEAVDVFNQKLNEIYKYGNKIIYCDFLSGEFYRNYVQVTDIQQFVKKIEQELEKYNDNSKKKPLKLVMFLDACDHVSRICRIIRQPQGNALLLGVGGSGRQSLTRLATFINSYDCFQIDVVKGYSVLDFAKSIKECLKQAGIKQAPTTFLIVDTQLVFPLMLEYINNILNSGDVPNIYKQDDIEEIRKTVKNEVLSKYGNMQDSNVMKVYLRRVLQNIHMVIAMSPGTPTFVQRLRMFPSLVNCCTLDWFTEWPEDALESVARDSFKYDSMNLDNCLEGLVQSFKFIHKKVEHVSKVYSNEMRRNVYLTPTSYLELLNMYQKILREKRREINQGIQRFENGLEVLRSAGLEVEQMQKKIEQEAPLLKEHKKNTDELLKNIEIEKAKSEIEQREATELEDNAKKVDEECSAYVMKVQEELKKLEPLITQALKAISNVKKDDLFEQADYKTLNRPVENMLEALLIFKMGDSWRTKDVMYRQGETSRNGNIYNIKEAVKKINFKDTERLIEDLKNFCDKKENLELLKTVYLKNIYMLRDFFIDNKVTYETAKKGSISIVGLYEYFAALITYVEDSITKIDPIEFELKKAQTLKAKAYEEKEAAKKRKDEAERLVKDLTDQNEKKKEEVTKLQKSIDDAKSKLERARQLIELLSGEQSRWKEEVEKLKIRYENLVGDCIIAASAICYNGPFTHSYRVGLENEWRKMITQMKLQHTPGITMKGMLEDKIEVNEWKVNGLPQDNLSIENGIIIKNTRRWPLLIDPQNQGSTFIKKLGKRREILDVIKASDPNFLNAIISSIVNCRWILLENVGVNLDPSLEPILLQQVTQKGGYSEIKIGEKVIAWSDKFKLYMSTTIPNPHYSPETFVKVTIINFGITLKGLEEQIMTLLINNEMPDLEQRKNAILLENFTSSAELRRTEDKILSDLSSSGGEISEFLNDDVLINSLKEAKTKSKEIKEKMDESIITNQQIDDKREKYRPAAFRASLLFFAIFDLSSIDPMYQFSLQWFAKLYEISFKTTPLSRDIETRINNLNNNFTKILFENVCRSLFEKDKLLFSFIICHKLLTGEYGEAKIRLDEWRYFLAGPTGEIDISPNPTNWISKNEWILFYRQLKFMNDNFEITKGLEEYFFKNHEKFKEIYESNNAHNEPLPDYWNEKITDFMKLCFIKMIRPDKLIVAIQNWIERNLGKDFVEPPSFSIYKSYKDSSNIIPLIFILSPGSDPINDINNFAIEQGYDKKFEYVSLGKGQEKNALDKLEMMRTKGGWVLLQNCHLAQSFMSKLEEIVENFDSNWPDKDFRLWMTSMSNDFFPVSVLQNSVKITIEPPKGLKNNLLRTYNKLENRDLDDCLKKNEYKTLIFGLSFFHAIVQDRRKYGPIGWNVRYDFTNEDWMVCQKQIKIFLEEYEGIPYRVLDYLLGDINYGGRVTDDKDQRLIKNILRIYLTPSIFKYSGYKFSKSGMYYCPEPGDHENYYNYINNLPVNSEPEVFGLHENADIITAQNEGYSLLDTVLNIQPRISGVKGKSQEEMIMEILTDIEKKTPPPFDKDQIFHHFPTDYNESMNTVLIQEVIRYNVLLNTMNKTIKILKKALTGKIVMSDETEMMSRSLFNNQVPSIWSGVFLSMKPLSSWIVDLTDRISFFQKWIDSRKTPNSFWISGKLN